MAENRVISFTSISTFFRENNNQLQRGECSYNSGNVLKAAFEAEMRPCTLKGEVRASMKNRTYSVEILFDKEDGIVSAKCSCPRGQVICHHMAAVCIFGHHNFSVTDKACAWKVSGQKVQCEVQTIEDMYPQKNKAYCAVGRVVGEEKLKKFIDHLDQPVGFTWLLQAEPLEEVINLVPKIEEIIFSKDFLESDCKIEYFIEKCKLDAEGIKKLANLTKGQANNENWLVCRKGRLTASHFGVVLTACQRSRFPPSLFRSVFECYNLDNIKAIEWGRTHENIALEEFSNSMNVDVQQTGLWLHECGFLGASPDGLVGEEAIVEVKCPYKFKDSSLQEALRNDKSYVIYKNETGNTIINKNHHYYHQIQGQLYFTNRILCYLVVWTPNETEVILIDRDADWEKNIEILKKFYSLHCVNYLESSGNKFSK